MSQWKETILLCYPEVVARVILMVMGIDNDFWMKCIADFQKSISTMNKPRIDQQPINKKGMDLEKRNT